MNQTTRRYILDLAERVFWTFLQGGLGVITVDALDLPVWAVVPVATGLALLKGLVAKKIGSGNTAATLPAYDDTPKA